MRTPLLAGLALGTALVLAGCADEEAPDWLVDQAAPATTTTAPTDSSAPPTTADQPGEDLAAIDLEPGVCIDDATAINGGQVNEITEIHAVPCRLPHGAEVYARGELRGAPDAEFPGVRQLRNRAQQRCRDGFEAFVGVPWTRSELEISALWPSPASWSEGDRAVVCAVFRLDGQPMTGSAEGSGI